MVNYLYVIYKFYLNKFIFILTYIYKMLLYKNINILIKLKKFDEKIFYLIIYCYFKFIR